MIDKEVIYKERMYAENQLKEKSGSNIVVEWMSEIKEHPCYYINDDYIFKEDVPFFGFKKGTDSKEVFKWQNI